jgi:hypothetical protein
VQGVGVRFNLHSDKSTGKSKPLFSSPLRSDYSWMQRAAFGSIGWVRPFPIAICQSANNYLENAVWGFGFPESLTFLV